jgi:flagellar assembly protein FliH
MARIIRSATLQPEPVVISYHRPDPQVVDVGPAIEILSESPDLPLSGLAPLSGAVDPDNRIDELRKQADRLEEQQQQLREEREQMRNEAELIRRQAEERGYKEGFEAGKVEGSEQWTAALQQLSALSGSAHAALERQITGVEDAIVEIAFSAVCKFIGEAAGTEEGIRNMARQAMQSVVGREGVVIRISPRDYEMLRSSGADRPFIEGANVEIAADNRVAAGGCLIETLGGTLDARLEIQLHQLLDILVQTKGEQSGA